MSETGWFGIYRGIVTNDNDPENLYRIQATVNQKMGPSFATTWAWPCMPPGWPQIFIHDPVSAHPQYEYTGVHTHLAKFPVPPIGSPVWIMFEGGDRDYPVWVGVWLNNPTIVTS